MNPRTPTGVDLEYECLIPKIEYDKVRNEFKKWLGKYSKKYADTVLRYLDKHLSGKRTNYTKSKRRFRVNKLSEERKETLMLLPKSPI